MAARAAKLKFQKDRYFWIWRFFCIPNGCQIMLAFSDMVGEESHPPKMNRFRCQVGFCDGQFFSSFHHADIGI